VKPNVLIIDDSQDVHDLLGVRLRSEDISLTHALDGPTGLVEARRQPDLILLDVDMPEMNGFDVIRRLKDDATTGPIPVIFLTANAGVDQKVTGFDLGAVDYVTKPFEPNELRARVRAALRTKRYQDLLASRANIDALTTLWNRAMFERRLVGELGQSHAVTLVMVDVDHFKKLNDAYGHPTGDRVLQAIGETLWSTVRESDLPCRYGGEEMAVVLPGSTVIEGRQVAERLRERIASLPLEFRGKPISVTASFGVATAGHDRSRDLLVQAADEALYRAKHGGRNRVECA
jgi:two-component system, cell cycle response regulator